MDLLTALLETCRSRGPAPALTLDRTTLSYTELAGQILSTRDGLLAAGLTPGDRVLFSVRPGPAGLVLALGAVAAGATVAFVDPGVGPELFASRFELVRPRWAAAESLLYAAGSLPGVRGLARRRGLLLPNYAALPVRHLYSGRWLPGVPRGAVAARSLLRAGTSGPAVAPAPDQDAVVVFTSGTTAAPKGVVHTRGSLGAGLGVLAARCELGPGDVVHTDQFMLGLPALVAGAHWTMPPYGFSARPGRFAQGLAGATHTFLVPADLLRVLDAIASVPTALRCVLLGAAPVTPTLLRRARAVLPDPEILAVYGMTEILPIAIAGAEEKLAAVPHGGDLMGAPLPGVRARLADDGELLVSGPNLCRGYLGHPPMTEHATGDLATLSDGKITLVGRKKDMIIRGTTNIYPGLYEPTIAALPGVAAAAMVGVPDELGDELVVLFLTPTVPNGQLADTVRAALPGLIDATAQPDRIMVIGELPVAGRSRKLDRAALRTLAAECA